MSRLSLLDHHVKATFQRGRVDLDELVVDLRTLLSDVEAVPERLLAEVLA